MNTLTNGISTVINGGLRAVSFIYTPENFHEFTHGTEIDYTDKGLADLFSLKGRVKCLSLTIARGTCTLVSTALAPLIIVIAPFAAIIFAFGLIFERKKWDEIPQNIGYGVLTGIVLIIYAIIAPFLNGALTIKCLSSALITPSLHLKIGKEKELAVAQPRHF